jgi:hypothetical protein
MTTHDVKLIGREEVAEGTMAFYFTKPAAFTFKPGPLRPVLWPQTVTTSRFRAFFRDSPHEIPD